MKHAKEVEVATEELFDEEWRRKQNPNKYDLETITLLAHLNGKATHLKYVFQSGNLEHFIQVFRALNKLANDLNCPALFISPTSEFSLSPFICGVVFDHQLLLVSPYGERIIEDFGNILNKLTDSSRDDGIKKIYLSDTVFLTDFSRDSSGPLCIELLGLFEREYQDFTQKFKQWSELPKERDKQFWKLSYTMLSIREIFGPCPLVNSMSKDEPLTWKNIRQIRYGQLCSIPAFQDDIMRAFWQIVLAWMSQGLREETLLKEGAYDELLRSTVPLISQDDIFEVYLSKLKSQIASLLASELESNHDMESDKTLGDREDKNQLLVKQLARSCERIKSNHWLAEGCSPLLLGGSLYEEAKPRFKSPEIADRVQSMLRLKAISGAGHEYFIGDNLQEFPEESMRTFKVTRNIFTIVLNGEIDALKPYLRYRPESVFEITEEGQTALHLAASFSSPTSSRLEIVKTLLSNGADAGVTDQEGRSAIHLAAKAPHAEGALELLFSHVWRINVVEHNGFIGGIDIQQMLLSDPQSLSIHSRIILHQVLDVQDERGMTPLHYAAASGNLASVKCLLIHGAAIGLREISLQATPLLWCFTVAPVEIIEKVLELFLAYTQQVGLKTEDKYGNTLMHYACLHGSFQLVQTLLSHGAITDTLNKKNERPLDWLSDTTSESSRNIIQCLTNPPVTKPQDFLLQVQRYKATTNYLVRLHGIGKQDSVVSTFNNRHGQEIVKGLGLFFNAPYETFTPSDLRESLLELNYSLAELSSLAIRLVASEKYLQSVDSVLHQELRCASYLSTYSCVIDLQESANFINNILIITERRLGSDRYDSMSISDKYVQLHSPLLQNIEKLEQKLLAIECMRIGGMNDAELMTIFEGHNINTIKMLYQDKSVLEVFKMGLAHSINENVDKKTKYSAVIDFFTIVQKFIHIVERIQHHFNVGLRVSPEFPADAIINQIVDQVNIVFDRQASGNLSDQHISRSVVESPVRIERDVIFK